MICDITMEDDSKKQQICFYCWSDKATVVISIPYEYDSKIGKDKISLLYCCDKCHMKLDPKHEFQYSNIASDFNERSH